jgi:glyoxylase-like metal-dependent hydrolase (beta-lactamase superfamily II)
MKVQKISDNVWKFTGEDNVNVYLITGEYGENIIIDAGDRSDRQDLVRLLGNMVDLKKITMVILTHLHYDHIGNFDLFPNAAFYASEQEINDLEKDRKGTILNEDIENKFKIKLRKLPEKIGPLEVIKSPGHTRGSVSLWYKEKKILFTGDTFFSKKKRGRTDLPTSAPDEMGATLMRLLEYNPLIIAPGHDY